MALNDASHRIIADLLASRTGQELTESRLWRVPSALASVFRERGISNVDQLVCLLANPGELQGRTGRIGFGVLDTETRIINLHTLDFHAS